MAVPRKPATTTPANAYAQRYSALRRSPIQTGSGTRVVAANPIAATPATSQLTAIRFEDVADGFCEYRTELTSANTTIARTCAAARRHRIGPEPASSDNRSSASRALNHPTVATIAEYAT